MTELQLYKFIEDNDIEWRWQKNEIVGRADVLIFPPKYRIEEFMDLLTPGIYDDGGIECTMMDGYFCFWMTDICEYYGADIEAVFPKEKAY